MFSSEPNFEIAQLQFFSKCLVFSLKLRLIPCPLPETLLAWILTELVRTLNLPEESCRWGCKALGSLPAGALGQACELSADCLSSVGLSLKLQVRRPASQGQRGTGTKPQRGKSPGRFWPWKVAFLGLALWLAMVHKCLWKHWRWRVLHAYVVSLFVKQRDHGSPGWKV